MTGEKIYEYDLDITGMTDYGVTLQAILSGEASVPPQGARIDVAFEGRATAGLLETFAASTMSGCVLMVGSTLISAQ